LPAETDTPRKKDSPGNNFAGASSDELMAALYDELHRLARRERWSAGRPDSLQTTAHQADGKVRIIARDGERLLFEVGFDGTTTWTEKGVMPKAEADAYWANNFGFGIIRRAMNDGFRIERAPDTNVEGHPVRMIRIIDPNGARTLFGIDRNSHYIRYMGFATLRGFHVRTYDDFVMLDNPRWLQAREVSLYYDGVKANTVYWKNISVDAPIDGRIFTAPKSGLAP
jgi:hypothetical protein